MRAAYRPGPWCHIWLMALGACMLAACPPKSQSQTVCVDCFDTQGYQLDLSAGTAAKPIAAVLFSGWRNGRCQDDVVCTGSPDVFLGDVRWGAVQWSVDCNAEDQEVIVFAGGHQPFDATPKLTPGQDGKLKSTITSVAFTGPLQVNVKIWVVANPSPTGAQTPAQAQAQAQARAVALTASDGEVVTPRRVFAESGTGIELVFSSDVFPSPGFARINDLYASASCDLLTDLTGLPAGYDAAKLNVYYVDGLQGNRAGLNCYDTGPGGSGQNVMFVAGNTYYSAMQLAHELGHAMGLLQSGPLPGGGTAAVGHVDEMLLDPWLATDNLMRTASDEVRQVTLGQTYRMHYDKLSWKWSGPSAPTAANGYPRECQNSPVKGGPCPPLTLHPTRGWP